MGSLFFHGMNFKKHGGMSLAEVILATAILGIVIVIIIGTLTTGLEALQKSTNYNQANIIAQRTIESYKAADYSSLVDGNSVTTEEGFNVHVNITGGTCQDQPYKKITVLVENEDKASKKKSASVKMETIFIGKL